MTDPIVYQVHTREWLRRWPRERGLCRLGDVPETEIDRLANLGFDFIWLLGVWQTGQAGAAISRTNAAWRPDFVQALPDLTEEDITGSTFAIVSYTVHRDFGGDDALAKLRRRFAERGMKLLLDFVPNHTALDHPWVSEHPEFYVNGSAADLAARPENYIGIGDRIFAHGRDPYFTGWPDTLQLNYGNPELQAAMLDQLRQVARRCDAVRCDMAMLLLPEIFQRTWGIPSEPFWERALPAARKISPEFVFAAEVYWGLERRLQQIGFDYTYDKTLYDLLVHQDAGGVAARLSESPDFLTRSVHFLENHDEPRAAAVFPAAVHKAAALLTFCLPGMRLFHDGQLEGYRRKPSIHLARRAVEMPDADLLSFYTTLLKVLRTDGAWRRLGTVEAWAGNPTSQEIFCFGLAVEGRIPLLGAVNFSSHQSQCYAQFPADTMAAQSLILSNVFGNEKYPRDGAELQTRGLYLDLQPWACQVFQVSYSTQNAT